MGCGSSAASKQLHAEIRQKEEDTKLAKKQIEEKDGQLQSLQAQHASLERQLRETEANAGNHDASENKMTQELVQQIEHRKLLHAQELQEKQELWDLQHREELRRQLDEKDRTHQRLLEEREQKHADRIKQETERAEQIHREKIRELELRAEDDVRKHQREAERASRDLDDVRFKIGELKNEKEDSAEALQEVREQLQEERRQRRVVESQLGELEKQLGSSQGQDTQVRARADAFERQAQQLRDELQGKNAELEQRNSLLHARERELSEVQQNLCGLQSLFDEVSQQLQTECSRVERLQSTVVLCAKQGQELQALQAMLEESHGMLSQVREALERERKKRCNASQLLEQERMRTRLLLDVLKHFKEKLQGLTPHMLLGRLSEAQLNGARTTGGGITTYSKTAPVFFDIGSPMKPGDPAISPGAPDSLWGGATPSLMRSTHTSTVPATQQLSPRGSAANVKHSRGAVPETLLDSLQQLEAAREASDVGGTQTSSLPLYLSAGIMEGVQDSIQSPSGESSTPSVSVRGPAKALAPNSE